MPAGSASAHMEKRFSKRGEDSGLGQEVWVSVSKEGEGEVLVWWLGGWLGRSHLLAQEIRVSG